MIYIFFKDFHDIFIVFMQCYFGGKFLDSVFLEMDK